ncbi:YkvA family protein [[Empedobacter] haloabium]|uniref:YkvA family protein n=1 Tax=[Empedobacter] haloabium TaxID=592317 RepID=A0ABZ1UKR0_9BURK
MRISDTLRTWARKIKHDGVTLWFACKDPGTPLAVKALCALVVAYALSPIDLIPDFIPVLGYLDDVILLPGMIWLAVRLIPTEVIARCRIETDKWMATNGRKPRTPWGIVFVVTVWIIGAWALWVYVLASHF